MVSASPAEVFRIALLVLMLPVYVGLWRGIPAVPGRWLLEASFLAVCLSFVSSLFDGGAAAPYAEAVTHLSIGVAGVFALATVVYARRIAGGKRRTE